MQVLAVLLEEGKLYARLPFFSGSHVCHVIILFSWGDPEFPYCTSPFHLQYSKYSIYIFPIIEEQQISTVILAVLFQLLDPVFISPQH